MMYVDDAVARAHISPSPISLRQAIGLAVAFACLSLLANRLFYGNFAFTRSYELYFVHAIENAAFFRRDFLLEALQYNPYLLPHRLFVWLRESTGMAFPNLLLALYFGFQILLMFAYMHLSQSLSREQAVVLLALALLALKYSPFLFGSAIGLNTPTLTPSLPAIVFQVLAISCFLRQKLVATASLTVIALYCHVLTSMFLALSFAVYALIHWTDLDKRQAVRALMIAGLTGGPLVISLLFLAIRNAAPLESWQLASAVEMAYGHVSLRLWVLRDGARVGAFFIVICGFMYAVVRDSAVLSDRTTRDKLLFLTVAATLFAILGGTLAEISATVAGSQPLKVAWFLQLFMGIWAVLVVHTVIRRQEVHPVSFGVACALFAMHASHEGGKLLAGGVSGMLLLLYLSRRVNRSQAGQRFALAAGALLIVLLFAGPYVAVGAASTRRGVDTRTRDFIDEEWTDIMRATNTLPRDAYILYPFSKHVEFFTLSERPGLFNTAYVAFLPLGGRLPSAHRYLTQLLRIDRNEHPVTALDAAWQRLSQAQVADIRHKYGVTHLIVEKRATPFQFPVVYVNSGYVLHELGERRAHVPSPNDDRTIDVRVP